MLARSDIRHMHSSYIARSKKFIIDNIWAGRMRVIHWLAVIITLFIVSRIIYINVFDNQFLHNQMNNRIMRKVKIVAMRGNILDRNGIPLAISTPVSSVWLDPTAAHDINAYQVRQLSNILNLPATEIRGRLSQTDKNFVYLKREVIPAQVEQINALGIEGVYSIQEYKRYYPNVEASAHVVGFTNVDDQGVEGIEFAKNATLVGKDGEREIIRDRQGDIVDQIGKSNPAVNGHDIVLSVDSRIQHIAYGALKNQVQQFHAKGGSAVVLDAKTGEVLAMVNYPDYNPNNRDEIPPDRRRNRAITDLYEPGSTMKPLLVAKVLDEHLVTPDTVLNVRPYVVGPKLIRDVHDHDTMTVAKIIELSSDVGSSKLAFKLMPKDLWEYNHDIGFGSKVNTGFPGEARGTLLPYKTWRPIDIASMSYGYAISTSVLQMARAYTIFTNNGCILPVSFYKLDHVPACTQIISSNTANTMRSILGRVTTDGTGRLAQLDDYTAAGKTGTAHKLLKSGGYDPHAYVSSFIGFAPLDAKIIIAVAIDDPRGSYYGGLVAAPIFSKIASSVLHMLNIEPDKNVL